MALAEVLGIAVVGGILAGFLGASLVVWAKATPIRLIGALLFPLLLPAAVVAAFSTSAGTSVFTVPDIITSVIALVVYVAFVFLMVRHVQRTADIPKQLEQLVVLRGMQDVESLKAELTPAKRAATFALVGDAKRHLVIVQGGISDLLGRVIFPEIVVNSENDYLKLGRIFDKNMSGALRYLDAVKDEGNRIIEDALEDKLRARLAGVFTPVTLGKVFETETTGLRDRGVKFIFHVATVQPRPAGGFTMNRDELARLFPTFITSCFEKYGELLLNGRLTGGSTILFPLIGAGDGGLGARDSARGMIQAIAEQMRAYRGIQEAYVVAFRQGDLQALRAAANELQQALVEETTTGGDAVSL